MRRSDHRGAPPAGKTVRTALAAASVMMAVLLPGTACARQAPEASEADGAFRAGKYEEAISGWRRLADSRPSDAAARRGLAQALMEVGRYREAEQAARAGGQDDVQLANVLGEALYARGEIAAAEAAFRRAAEGGADDSLRARLNLAVLLHERGQHDEAKRLFDSFIDVYNRSETLSAPALVAVGTAVRYLGTHDHRLFSDALKAYDEAIAADPGSPEARVLVGDLFMDRYQSTDAQSSYREVLNANPNHPRALLGMARAKHFDGSSESLPLVQKSLEANPNLVPARLLLARLHMDDEDDAAAEAEIRRALAVNPASLEALSMLAAVSYLRGDRQGYEEARQQVLRLNPRYAGLYVTLGELAVRRRRYREASDMARQAVALDSAAWSAHGMLGLNALRLGKAEEARPHLDRAFAGDPYNVWVKNTLDLLDTYHRYRTVRTPRFELFIRGDEADLLSIYAAELAEEAYDRLAERYGYRPEAPLRVEFYPNSADFSVRSIGHTGLGALGVAFGNVLALDSPSAREKGEFNWATTLWHEIAHAVTLGMSNHRVPRWLTEGLSVLEERRARPGWGSESSPEFLLAYRDGKLPSASRLSEVFVRPESPEQLGHGYHLASLLVEWIEEKHGFGAIRALLRGFGEGRTDEQLIRSVLRSDPERFDRDFDAWVRERHAPQLAALGRGMPGTPGGGEVGRQMLEARKQMEAGDLEAAKRALQRAAEAFPQLTGQGSPYSLLAEIHLRQGDKRAAADALTKLTALDENAYEENLRLAELLDELGDARGAAAALERAVFIYPMEVPPHVRLAELYSGLGDARKAVRERRAVVALDPVDRADALYQLALALRQAGDGPGARREVLRALEAAPSFQKAQELLLELGSGGR